MESGAVGLFNKLQTQKERNRTDDRQLKMRRADDDILEDEEGHSPQLGPVSARSLASLSAPSHLHHQDTPRSPSSGPTPCRKAPSRDIHVAIAVFSACVCFVWLARRVINDALYYPASAPYKLALGGFRFFLFPSSRISFGRTAFLVYICMPRSASFGRAAGSLLWGPYNEPEINSRKFGVVYKEGATPHVSRRRDTLSVHLRRSDAHS